jgi:hypothetical protein
MAEQVLRHSQVSKFARAAADTPAREVTFVASDESLDSYGDIVRAAGWELQRFLANPVLLFAHNNHEPPIGQVVDIGVKGTELIARARFLDAGVYPKADIVWNAIEVGALRAVSVGFMPTKAPNEIKHPDTNQWTGGYEFIGQELMELSVVPIPANANALAVARSLGISAEQWDRMSMGNRERWQPVEAPRSKELAQMKTRRMRFAITPMPR